MKRLVALILLAPVVASAQAPCIPSEIVRCGTLGSIFAGSLTLTDGASATGNGSASWDAFGGLRPDAPSYENTGSSPVRGAPAFGLSGIGLASPIPYGSFADFGFYEHETSGLVMGLCIEELTENCVPWRLPFNVAAAATVIANFENFNTPITHAGTYTGDFSLVWSFTGQPATAPRVCSALTPCTEWQSLGAGVGSFYVSDFPDRPNTFYITGGFFRFQSVLPEPSAASLLLLGFAGLAILGWRRRSRATLIQTG
jgi:hypothetical protein